MSGVKPNWRDTYRHSRFFFMDGRILFLVLPTLLYPRYITLGMTAIVVGFLYYFEKRLRMDVSSAVRMIRSILAGPQRPIRRQDKLRSRIDYQRIDRAAALREFDDLPKK